MRNINKYKKVLILFIILLSFVIFLINNFNNNFTKNNILLVFTSMNNGSSIVSFDINKEKFIDTIEYNSINSLTFGAFMKNFQIIDNNAYCATPLNGNDVNDGITQINLEKGNIKNIKMGIGGTAYIVDKEFIFYSLSNPENSKIVKKSLKDDILYENIVETSIEYFFKDDNGVYLLGKNYKVNKDNTIIYKLDDKTLEIDKIYELQDSTVTDVLVNDNYIFLALDKNNKKYHKDEILKYNKNDKKIEYISLEFNKINRLHLYNDNLFAVQYDSHNELKQNNISIINIFSNEIISNINRSEENTISMIFQDKFIVCDNKKMSFYDVNNFNLLKQVNLPILENKTLVGIINN